jgi:hypothetical protein
MRFRPAEEANLPGVFLSIIDLEEDGISFK